MAPRNPHINIPRLVPRALSLSLSLPLSPSSVRERAAVSAPSSILSPSPASPHSSPPEKSSPPPCTARHSAESHLSSPTRESSVGQTHHHPHRPAGPGEPRSYCARTSPVPFLTARRRHGHLAPLSSMAQLLPRPPPLSVPPSIAPRVPLSSLSPLSPSVRLNNLPMHACVCFSGPSRR